MTPAPHYPAWPYYDPAWPYYERRKYKADGTGGV
jgi:hypothetical protein